LKILEVSSSFCIQSTAFVHPLKYMVQKLVISITDKGYYSYIVWAG